MIPIAERSIQINNQNRKVSPYFILLDEFLSQENSLRSYELFDLVFSFGEKLFVFVK
jgi:hypothetical protein